MLKSVPRHGLQNSAETLARPRQPRGSLFVEKVTPNQDRVSGFVTNARSSELPTYIPRLPQIVFRRGRLRLDSEKRGTDLLKSGAHITRVRTHPQFNFEQHGFVLVESRAVIVIA